MADCFCYSLSAFDAAFSCGFYNFCAININCWCFCITMYGHHPCHSQKLNYDAVWCIHYNFHDLLLMSLRKLLKLRMMKFSAVICLSYLCVQAVCTNSSYPSQMNWVQIMVWELHELIPCMQLKTNAELATAHFIQSPSTWDSHVAWQLFPVL